MDADLKKIKKLVTFMRKQGVLTLKQADIELSLSPASLQMDFDDHMPKVETINESELKSPYDETDMLFWSAPGLNDEVPN